MTYIKWRDSVGKRLKEYPEGQRQTILTIYADRYAHLRMGGLSEEDAVDMLGSPKRAAREIKREYIPLEKNDCPANMPEGTQANPLVRAVFSLGIIVLLSAMLALVLFLGAVPVALIGSGGYLLATTLIPVIAEGIPFAATANFVGGCALAGGGIIILPFIIYICKAVVKSMRPLADMLNAAAKKKI